MTRRPSVVLGYHGCDARVGKVALSKGVELRPSNKDYDWLGPGVYFWENDPIRALEWAESKVTTRSYSKACVVGAAIDLGNCLDLTLRENVDLLAPAYQSLRAINRAAGLPMPRNRDARSKTRGDKLLRYLDCAVIRHFYAMIADPISNNSSKLNYIASFDSVRGLFVEGRPIYPGSGFYAQTHTQIAVLNSKCILGVFEPRG